MSVKDDSPASRASVQPRDFIVKINGQVVFDLAPRDIERIIRDSGTSLLLDIER